MKSINIYGDNILECEEAMSVIAHALGAEVERTAGSLYAPMYSLTNHNTHLGCRLFPAYDRWDYDVKLAMKSKGARLRESPDAIVTAIHPHENSSFEIPILAFEFSGALPAGNNAWQRTGRALSCAESSVPYLYFAELGGLELGANRQPKAPRFPNPTVPFGYLSLGLTYETIALPVYFPSPSITDDLRKEFADVFAGDEVYRFISTLLQGKVDETSRQILKQKALQVTVELTKMRRQKSNILNPSQWSDLSNLSSGSDRADWFIEQGMEWYKRISIDTSDSFRLLFEKIQEIGVFALGSRDMPFCILPSEHRPQFVSLLRSIYGKKIDDAVLTWLAKDEKHLVLVWIAGFKPRGDDSRPDRGLVPLARMLVGEKDVDLLSVVYGPGKKAMWNHLQSDMWGLARSNGLWEAILHLSDGLLIDHNNAKTLDSYGFIVGSPPEYVSPDDALSPLMRYEPHQFGEHDVDTVLHTVLTEIDTVFESLCNPPGGDWSGMSLYDFKVQRELRWISLPRVSGEDAKRPDHIFQFGLSDRLLIIESKDTPSSVEDNIGKRLKKYVQDLLESEPNAFRQLRGRHDWLSDPVNVALPNFRLFSAAAFQYTHTSDMDTVIQKSGTDIVIGVEFREKSVTKFHVWTVQEGEWFISIIRDQCEKFAGYLEVEIY